MEVARKAAAAAGRNPDEVIDRFGIAGPSGYCIDRLSELNDLGLEADAEHVVAEQGSADPALPME